MRLRDGIVIGVLGVSAMLAGVLWHPAGRWVALAVLLAGVLLAAVVYRLAPPAFGLHDVVPVPDVPPEQTHSHPPTGDDAHARPVQRPSRR